MKILIAADMGEMFPPFRLQPPITVTIEFSQSVMADRAALLPGATRASDRRVEFIAENMVTAYRAFRVLVTLAGQG